MESKIKRTIAILLAVCFLVSLTASSAAAWGEEGYRGHDGHKQSDHGKYGFDHGGYNKYNKGNHFDLIQALIILLKQFIHI